MNIIWRFFVGEDSRWRWQQLSTDRIVISESRDSYEQYERCISAAKARGYLYEAAQHKLPRNGIYRRS